MTARTTRNKIRWQATKVIDHLNKCQGHLKFMDDLAEGESTYINQYLPTIVSLLDEMIKTVQNFREGL